MAHQRAGHFDGVHRVDGTFEGQKGTGKEKRFESELVRELYSLGAIPIAKVCNMILSRYAESDC